MLTEEFSDIIVSGAIESISATKSERRDNDNVELDRVAFHFNRHGFARMQELIWRINELGDQQLHQPGVRSGSQPADTAAFDDDT